jgi:hypothetical protein
MNTGVPPSVDEPEEPHRAIANPSEHQAATCTAGARSARIRAFVVRNMDAVDVS